MDTRFSDEETSFRAEVRAFLQVADDDDFPLRGACAAVRLRIDRFDLWRNGAHALYLDGGIEIVKQFLRDASGAQASGSRHLPAQAARFAPTFGHLSKAIRPSEAELARNPRARSATLRAAVRSDAPARERKVA